MPEHEESAADRLEKDPRPKGEPVSRGPTLGAPQEPKAERKIRERDETIALPGTDAQETVHPKQME